MVRNVFFVLALAACGGHADDKPEAEHHDMEHMPADLAQFHDVLAPHWHAAAGPARRQGTCEAVGDFKKRAAAVTTGQQLVAAVGELERVCTTKGSDADFDAAFGKVHESFHHALEAAQR